MAQIDPSIALSFRQPQFQDPINQFAKAQELSVNALKMNEMQRGIAQENKLRELFASGADLDSPETTRQLYGISPKIGAEFEKSRATLKKEKFGAQKMESEAVDSRLKLSRQLLDGISTPEQYIAWHEANHRDPVLGPLLAARGITADQSRQKITTALSQPGGLQQLINESKMGVEKFAEQNTISAAQQQTADVTRRGQDISAATTRRGQDIGRIPVGYRMTPEGTIEAIPGGPTTTNLSPKEVQLRESKFPQATQAVKTFEAKTTELEKDLLALKNHPGLASITGLVAGRAPGITAQGRAAEALYDKIMARGGFKELQDMRAASPTGGALGNISNQEGTQLRAAFAAIDRKQDAADVQKAIDIALGDLQASKGRIREAYNMTYDYKGLGDSNTPPPPPPPGPSGNTVTIPSGKVLTFPTPEAAAAYRQAAGL
jgi:hypothetical protein